MRISNIVLVVIGLAGIAAAVVLARRGANLPVVPERPTTDDRRPNESVGGALADGLRRVTGILAAGWVAGFLVVGLGGRLVMRILGATSGDVAQGRLTDAEEMVGEITFGGSVGFVIFAGSLIPIAAACLYLPVRRFLPNRAWQSGLLYSVLLLASSGSPTRSSATASTSSSCRRAGSVWCWSSPPPRCSGSRSHRWSPSSSAPCPPSAIAAFVGPAWIPYLALIGLINPIGLPIVPRCTSSGAPFAGPTRCGVETTATCDSSRSGWSGGVPGLARASWAVSPSTSPRR